MITSITRDAVLAAIAECDRAGLRATLSWHGFGRAITYEVIHGGRRYPSKALIGIAAGYDFDEPFDAATFSGGLEHSARQLVRLGFAVERGAERLTVDDVAPPAKLNLKSTVADLRLYVVRPTNARTIKACYQHRFGSMIAPVSVRTSKRGVVKLEDLSNFTTPLDGLPYVLDNGAWPCSEAGLPWQRDPFLRLLERLGPDLPEDGWVVLPDIVGGGERSLDFSVDFHAHHRSELRGLGLALAVQDGMTPDMVRPVLAELGCSTIFVGGSAGKGTPNWKWKSLHLWTQLGLELGLRVHVGRVNGERRAKLCSELGATSIDGRAVTMYAVNATKMARSCDGSAEPPSGESISRARLEIARRGFAMALDGKP